MACGGAGVKKPKISRVRITNNGIRLSGPIANEFMNEILRSQAEKEQSKQDIKEVKENDAAK